MRRCKILDRECSTEEGTRYFLDALKMEFHSGGVHPLRAHGETNVETIELRQNCTMLAAAREENSDASPLDNTVQK